MTNLAEGYTASWTRTFTEEDVRRFAEVSGDHGAHHVAHDAQGRLLVHGLLTATLPTKLGGDLNYLARTMTFEFRRPVWSGDTIEVQAEAVEVAPHQRGQSARLEFRCTNQHGDVVLTGTTDGVVPDER